MSGKESKEVLLIESDYVQLRLELRTFPHRENNKKTEISPVRRVPLHKNIMEQSKSGTPMTLILRRDKRVHTVQELEVGQSQ